MKTDNELINPYEGNKVDTLIWPFYRYSALIPEQIDGDLFVWLYLSLISYENQNQGFARENYNESVKQNVEKILLEKFSEIIDYQTLEKIENNAETQFIDGKKIKENAFSFIDTYESLFSDKLDMKYIYQDAITGEVLPFFGDTSGIKYVKNPEDERKTEDASSTGKGIRIRNGIKEPSAKAVRNAYLQYIKIKRHNGPDIDQYVELENEYCDEDEQTFLDVGVEEVPFSEEKEEVESLNNYNIIFLKDKQVIFNLEVPIYIEDNELVAHSPFGKNTNQWIDRCMKKGRNVSTELNEQLIKLEEQFVIKEKEIEEYIERNRKDFASSLTAADALPKLYRMIDALNDYKFREYVIAMDFDLRRGSESFYNHCGKYLERLINKASYNESNEVQRATPNYAMYCIEIRNKCKDKITPALLLNEEIFRNWQRNRKSLKTGMADIILRTNLVDSSLMYRDFINDMFSIYSKRNVYGSHDNDNKVDIQMTDVDKLLKITQILFELI